MKLKKIIVKILTLVVISNNLTTYPFANYTNNEYFNEISNIQTKEDLQESAQKAIKTGTIDTWITGLANMPTPSYSLASVVVDDKIYCIGGYNGSFLNKVEVYDPATNSWETKASMPTPRSGLTSAVIDGKIYCIGGYNGQNKVEVYDPATDSWETKTSMPTPRVNLTSVVVGGKIYCIGGFDGSSTRYNTVEVYDPAADSWETKTNMITPRDGLSSAVADGKIYCIGGWNNSFLNTVEVYDPAADSWETKTSMITGRGYLTSAVIDNKIYCIGGYNGSSTRLNEVEMYNPVTDSWEAKTSMPTSRSNLTSVVIDDKIYCIGGRDNSSYFNTVEAYDVLLEQIEESVEKAESSRNPEDIKNARDLVNKLPESSNKDILNDRLNAILPNIDSPTPQSVSGNSDIYIKMKNVLSLSLDTNVVIFEDFSGTEDIEKQNAISLTVVSSLPYEVNAFLESEIQNSDGSKIIDKSTLGIKLNNSTDYGIFTSINTPLNLLNNQAGGQSNTHGIDLILKKNIQKADVYKTTIKFEANQK